MHERRFDASLAHRLDQSDRLLWLPPQEVLAALDLHAGQTVADLGAGTGYFTLPMAAAVGATGRVLAVDAQQEMLAHLAKKLSTGAAASIELVHAEADRTTLGSGSCDLAFLANVWHEFADRATVLAEVRRILKPGGRIALLDWRPDVAREQGPPLDHRLSATSAVAELTAAGFCPISQSNVGQYAWLVLAARKG